MYYSESDLFVMRVNKKKLEKILIFIEVILIVFQSGTIQSSLNADSIIFKASQIIMLIIAFYFTCRRLMLREKRNLNNKCKVNKKMPKKVSFYCFYGVYYK